MKKLLRNRIFICFLFSWFINNASATTGYWYNLYCKAPDGKTLSTICHPAIEGAWEFWGGSYNYQHQTPRYGSMDEVSRDMESYIDTHFNYCKPTAVSPYGPMIPGSNADGSIFQSYEMLISVGIASNGSCNDLSGTWANSYNLQKQFFCPTGAQGPYKTDDDDYRFCVYPQKFQISILGPSETQALPSLTGPIKQTIKINGEDGPAKNWGVTVKMVNEKGEASYAGGSTNAQGIYEFYYVPPYFKGGHVDLSASCTGCESPAQKNITIMPTLSDQLEEPQMCRR